MTSRKSPSTSGSLFEQLRAVVRRIPAGRVMTYGDVAQAAGHPTASRQVAWALKNADALSLPWQRVIGKGGKILLRGAAGVEQVLRLEAEGVAVHGTRVDLARFGFIPRPRSGRSQPRRQGATPSPPTERS